ncbi:MAG TPA: c-type cytochrome [Burkholderiaceae bacterium]|nr:c-type cytochrome [Burkholderiaceae bacterium]
MPLGFALSFNAAYANAKVERQVELCLICHKVDNLLFAPAPEGQTRMYLYNQMLAYKEKRRTYSTMQTNLASLANDDIRQIAEYFAAQKPLRTTFPVNSEKAARGKTAVEKLGCASCHQPDYSGHDEVPRLAGMNPRYLRWQLISFSADSRPHPSISRSCPMSELDAEDIAHYLTQLGQ